MVVLLSDISWGGLTFVKPRRTGLDYFLAGIHVFQNSEGHLSRMNGQAIHGICVAGGRYCARMN